MITMDPQIKADWVAALRSPRYAQATGVLRNENGMCCLGVLCDRLDPEGWTQDVDGNFLHRLGGQGTKSPWGADTTLAYSCERKLGLIHGGSVMHALTNILANKNDKGIDFFNIADWIEENL